MIDMTGKRIGKLTVIEQNGSRYGQCAWKCLCDCGNYVTVVGMSLRRGATRSCGCLLKDVLIERNKRPTLYTIVGDTAVCYTSNGKEFYVDAKDVGKIADKSWWVTTGNHLESNDSGTKILLHRYLLGLGKADDVEVDHKDRNPLNNRKSNLRICSSKENQRNIGLRTNNTSGYTGVWFDSQRKKWRAKITVNGTEKYLGRYERFEDAVWKRYEAEQEFFCEFAPHSKQDVIKILREYERREK